VASPRSPGGLPHASPGAEPDDAHTSSVEGCPRAAAWSGCARSTGCHDSPSVQDRLLGPSPGRRTSRSSEKPGEVAKAFLLVNSTASSRWRRWGRVGRTSWPISRILSLRKLAINYVACCWRAISPGKPRSIGGSCDPRFLQVEAPDHALGTVFQTGHLGSIPSSTYTSRRRPVAARTLWNRCRPEQRTAAPSA
jgi:hypothetical protein